MTRSVKHHPGGGIASNAGQKKFRSSENKAKRTKVKQVLSVKEYDSMPHEKEYGNEWSSPRDGKQYWIKHDKKWMRK